MNTNYLSREILLVAEEDDRSSLLTGQLEEMGFMVTRSTEPNTVKDLLENKYFVAGVFELDTPKIDFGLSLLSFAQEKSPETHVFVLATRESFNAAVGAYRGGAKDVIVYEVESLPYLVTQVVKSASRIAYDKDRDRLLTDMASVHKHFFKKLLSMHIKLMETETQLRYKEGVADMDLPPMRILLVDGDSTLNEGLSKELENNDGWEFTHCTWGSEALDYGASGNYQVALINQNLPDLPGSMICSTVKSTAPETTILMFNYKGGGPQIALFEGSNSTEIPIQGDDPSAVAHKLRDIRQALAASSQKEEHVKSFKAQHYEFLQKYSRLKNKFKNLMERAGDNVL